MNAKIIVLLVTLSLSATCNLTGQSLKKFRLVMRTTGELQLHDGNTITMYGFAANKTDAPIFPAPSIIVYEGDTVEVEATNISQSSHTIHFHGLDMNDANGGNPVTSFALSHRQKYTYRFVAHHAGTYMYYCSVSAAPFSALGMYGSVIVHPKLEAKLNKEISHKYDAEYSWITSEIDTLWNNYFSEISEDQHLKSLPPFAPQYFLINAKSAPRDAVKLNLIAGSASYLRIANAGLSDNQYIFPHNLQVYLIDADGRTLPYNRLIDTLTVSPGQRYGVLLHPNHIAENQIMLNYINLATGIKEASKKISVTIKENREVRKEDISINEHDNYTANVVSIAFKYPIYKAIEVYCYDIQGKLLTNIKFQFLRNNRILEFPINQLNKGFYYLVIKIDGQVFYKKVNI